MFIYYVDELFNAIMRTIAVRINNNTIHCLHGTYSHLL